MNLRFNQDELILLIVALVRAIDPAMLTAEGDGFSVDFDRLSAKTDFSSDETLLLRLREAGEGTPSTMTLTSSEAQRLAELLNRLEILRSWPADVMAMSRSLRSRLSADPSQV